MVPLLTVTPVHARASQLACMHLVPLLTVPPAHALASQLACMHLVPLLTVTPAHALASQLACIHFTAVHHTDRGRACDITQLAASRSTCLRPVTTKFNLSATCGHSTQFVCSPRSQHSICVQPTAAASYSPRPQHSSSHIHVVCFLLRTHAADSLHTRADDLLR